MTDTRGDVRDLASLERAIESFRPEIIIHLAAQSLVRASYQDPITTLATNIMGTANLLDAVRRASSVSAVVVVTSDKCYEPMDMDRGYREGDPMGGHDPYSTSKGCAELVATAFRRSFFETSGESGAGIATARAGNVIGGGDWAVDRLVPDLIRGYDSGIPVLIRNPLATRPWQHVLEPLHGYLVLAEHLFGGDRMARSAWNFGPREADIRPVSWIADEVARRWGRGAQWQLDPQAHPHEARTLNLDIRKSLSHLAWRPELDLGEALAWTVDWHRQLKAGVSARDLVLADIDKFQNRLSRAAG
jgi:CDP-glucose 4,6-dehydratase